MSRSSNVCLNKTGINNFGLGVVQTSDGYEQYNVCNNCNTKYLSKVKVETEGCKDSTYYDCPNCTNSDETLKLRIQKR